LIFKHAAIATKRLSLLRRGATRFAINVLIVAKVLKVKEAPK
jgi:hypothetical protein